MWNSSLEMFGLNLVGAELRLGKPDPLRMHSPWELNTCYGLGKYEWLGCEAKSVIFVLSHIFLSYCGFFALY
jgi:hypothetical protein